MWHIIHILCRFVCNSCQSECTRALECAYNNLWALQAQEHTQIDAARADAEAQAAAAAQSRAEAEKLLRQVPTLPNSYISQTVLHSRSLQQHAFMPVGADPQVAEVHLVFLIVCPANSGAPSVSVSGVHIQCHTEACMHSPPEPPLFLRTAIRSAGQGTRGGAGAARGAASGARGRRPRALAGHAAPPGCASRLQHRLIQACPAATGQRRSVIVWVP